MQLSFGVGASTVEASQAPTTQEETQVDKIEKEKSEFRKNLRAKSKAHPVNVRCATHEENAKLTEINEKKRELYAQRAEARTFKNDEEVKRLTIELLKLDAESSEILKPIRERQSANTIEDEKPHKGNQEMER